MTLGQSGYELKRCPLKKAKIRKLVDYYIYIYINSNTQPPKPKSLNKPRGPVSNLDA